MLSDERQAIIRQLRELADKLETEALDQEVTGTARVGRTQRKKKLMVTLFEEWEDCERGNTLLVHENGDFNAWLRVNDSEHPEDNLARLEISWRAENYPALEVRLVEVNDHDLYRHLVKTFGTTWKILKLNLGDHNAENLLRAWQEAEEAGL